MKILYLTPTDVFSGGERVTLQIAQAMQQRGHTVVYAGREGVNRAFVEKAGVRFVALADFTMEAVCGLAKEEAPDLIHTMDYRASLYASRTGLPFVAHLHNNCPWLKTWGANSWAMLLFGLKAGAILTVSDSVMDEYVLGWVLKKKTTVLPNIVRTADVRAAAAAAPPAPGYDLGFIGRLTEQKQPLTFVEIVAQLHEKRPALTAVMLGGGELEPDIRAAITQNGLENVITMTGFLADPFPALAACRVVLMPSAWEGFGLTAVEALALGRPVLGSPVGGLQNILTPECGGTCRTVPEYVEKALALLEDKTAYAAASSAAVQRAEQFADEESYNNTVENIYKKIPKV